MSEEEVIKGICSFNHAETAHTCDCFCTPCIKADDKFATLPYYRRQEILSTGEAQKSAQ